MDHAHSHVVVGSRHGHLNHDHHVFVKGGNHLLLFAASGLVHKHDSLVGDVVLKNAGDKALEVGTKCRGETRQDFGNVVERHLFIHGHEVVTSEVAELMSEADKGIVTGSEHGDTGKATVLGLSEGAIETYGGEAIGGSTQSNELVVREHNIALLSHTHFQTLCHVTKSPIAQNESRWTLLYGMQTENVWR